MLVYVAEYCPCKYESEFGTVSIHVSKQNAQKTIFRMKNEFFEEQRENYLLFGLPEKGSRYIHDWQQFRVRPMVILK